MKTKKRLSENDLNYVTVLIEELSADLYGLINPTKSNVQFDENLGDFLNMIWIDHFDELSDYFNFDWIKSDSKIMNKVAEQHVELDTPASYPVPKISKKERTIFISIETHLKELHESLLKM